MSMSIEVLFAYQPGVDRRKEQALRMISEGHSFADVRLQLRISHKTLTVWIKAGLPKGDPDPDQLSLVDGLTERERRRSLRN